MKNILAIAIVSMCTAQGLEAQTWSTSGNAVVAGNFLGTTNNMPLIFKVNNTGAGLIDPVNYNTGLGAQSLIALTTGNENCGFGYQALYSNTTGYSNTASGYQSLLLNSSGYLNTATGYNTLSKNTTGTYNTATGAQTMYFNTTGNYNTATGSNALTLNTTGSSNTGTGFGTLYGNTTGNNNTADGTAAMNGNNTGSNNTADGYWALKTNTGGSDNTATGSQALTYNTTGNNNTADGFQALNAETTGGGNVALGTYSLINQTTGSNNIGIGFGAYPTSSTALTNWVGIGTSIGSGISASNMVELGNSSVTSIRQQVASTIVSDGRIKDNVKANVPGLEFINLLRPVTYNLNIHRQNEMIYKNKETGLSDWDGKYDIEKMTMTGFIAQEVEKAAKDAGYDFSGVEKPATPDGLYGVRYSDFIMPLVKSVQELSASNDALKKQNDELQTTVSELKNMVLDMQQSMSQCCSNYQAYKATSLINSNTSLSPVLNQNVPNPFTVNTVISCTIPGTFQQAEVKVINSIGTEILSFPVQQTGISSFTVNGSTLAAGIYQYTLIIDGRVVDTKKMVLLAQ